MGDKMAKSGITRRIDELGRIVIPKEIRKNLKIHDCDEIDISLDGNSVILNKHELNNNDKLINLYIYSINKYLNKNILFTSKDKIISYSIVNKEIVNELELNSDIKKIINNRNSFNNKDSNISLFLGKKYNYIINPLIINGDLIGSIILYSNDDINKEDINILNFSKMFLENYLE